jgi:hypothetical protein
MTTQMIAVLHMFYCADCKTRWTVENLRDVLEQDCPFCNDPREIGLVPRKNTSMFRVSSKVTPGSDPFGTDTFSVGQADLSDPF